MSKTPDIFVTQPSLPPLEDFMPYLQQIWDKKLLTNGGPFHQALEQALCRHLGVQHLSLFTNGTIALVTALQALGIKGEVITTPYSFVATAHALLWNDLKPVFVDIDPVSLNLNPDLIEAAITENTTAILPVHVYGRPCDVDRIEQIAARHQLKVIYDAAHAFGVQCHCGSLLQHGDLSVLSFHATKVFNTFEGGAIISRTAEEKKHIDHLKNFGFEDEVTVVEAGINGKMSEFNSALGLLQLDRVDAYIADRQKVDAFYRQALTGIPGIQCVPPSAAKVHNYGYFPILVDEQAFGSSRDALYDKLRHHHIYARRYFYPLISEFPMYAGLPSALATNLPIASQVARQVLCLPIYPGIEQEDLQRIVRLIKE